MSRQRNVLLHQNILNLSDIYITCRSSVGYRNSCRNACRLAGADTLRYQRQPINGHIVGGDVTARAEEVFNLLRQD